MVSNPIMRSFSAFNSAWIPLFTKNRKWIVPGAYATASAQKILNGTQPFCMASQVGNRRCSKLRPVPGVPCILYFKHFHTDTEAKSEHIRHRRWSRAYSTGQTAYYAGAASSLCGGIW